MLTPRALQRHLNAEVLARVAQAPMWIAAALFAGWRLLVGLAVPVVGAVLAAGALVAIFLRFRRAAWTRAQALIALDRAAGAGGLALTLVERAGPDWQPQLDERLAHARLPPRNLERPIFAVGAAILFAAAALLVPRPVEVVPPIQIAAQTHVLDAELKADALKAEEKLDAALLAELERLKQEAETGRFDAADWAALDAVNEALDQAATQRANDLANAQAAAERLAQAADSKAGEEAEQRAREQLEDALAALGSDGQEGAQGQQGAEGSQGQEGQEGQPGEGQQGKPKQGEGKQGEGEQGEGQQQGKQGQQAKSGSGKQGKGQSGASAKELAKALEQRRKSLEKGTGAGSGSDRWASNKGLGEGQSGSQSPTRYVHEHGEGKGDGQGDTAAPSSGGGAAPVTFGPQHPIDPDDLKLDALPKDPEGDPTELEGIRKVAPHPGEEAPGGTLGAPVAGPDGVVPSTAPLAPRHRDLVKRYFDRKTGDKR